MMEQMTPLPSPSTPERLNDLRKRVLAGDDVSVDEYRELIAALRQKRSGDLADASASGRPRKMTPRSKAILPDILQDI